MSEARITHVGFSDESHWNTGQFRSLGLVTCPSSLVESLETKLRDLLGSLSPTEFKWSKLKDEREKPTADAMCCFAVDQACARNIRVDVLIWDTRDSRHNVQGRDDIRNLQIMYYQLFKNVLRARWPDGAVWRLSPDEDTSMDWRTIQDFLETVSVKCEAEGSSLLTNGKFRLRLRQEFDIEEIQPVRSDEYLLLGLADLFAGLAVFSRDKFNDYQTWLPLAQGQSRLFDYSSRQSHLSHRDRVRFQVLHAFNRLCKDRCLGVSLNSYNGLRTPDPANPLNFWFYEPQHAGDKAPRRSSDGERSLGAEA